MNRAQVDSSPDRVLHIGKYFPPAVGGMETYLHDLVVALADIGVTSSVLVHREQLGFRTHREHLDAGGRRLGLVRAATWIRCLFTPVSPTFPVELARIVRRERPSLLHLHMPNMAVFWALFLPGCRRLPWVVHWHSEVSASEHNRALKLLYRVYRPLEQAILQRARAIIVTSQPYLEASRALSGYRNKCTVIPLGLDHRHLPQPARPRGTAGPDDPLRVLAIGRLAYFKGFDVLVRALSLCDRVELDLLGSGEQERLLQRRVAELGLEARVRLHGNIAMDAAGRQRMAQFLEDADCLCLPSIERTESFGLVLLEAMFYRRATIATSVPGSGMGWVVADGDTGVLVPPGDPAALAGALENLRCDRARLAAMGERGRERFERLFRIESSALQVLECYQSVLQTSAE